MGFADALEPPQQYSGSMYLVETYSTRNGHDAAPTRSIAHSVGEVQRLLDAVNPETHAVNVYRCERVEVKHAFKFEEEA